MSNLFLFKCLRNKSEPERDNKICKIFYCSDSCFTKINLLNRPDTKYISFDVRICKRGCRIGCPAGGVAGSTDRRIGGLTDRRAGSSCWIVALDRHAGSPRFSVYLAIRLRLLCVKYSLRGCDRAFIKRFNRDRGVHGYSWIVRCISHGVCIMSQLYFKCCVHLL